MNKRTTKQHRQLDGNKNILKTTSCVHFNKSSSKSNFPNANTSQIVSVKKKSFSHIQTGQMNKRGKQHNQTNNTVNNVKSGNHLKIEKTTSQKTAKHNIEVKAGIETQTKQQSKQISLPSVKQVQHIISKDVANGSPRVNVVPKVENGETSSKQQFHKKKPNGNSNWMQLCTTLNIDASVRKTKPVKRPAPDNDTEQTEPKRAKPGVWFDNVDKIFIETSPAEGTTQARSGVGGGSSAEHDTSDRLVKSGSFTGVTNCVAMDCEMVGVGPQGEESILARVSVVNHFGVCLYDKFVLPREKVTDYRTHVSGVTAEKLATGEEFTKVQTEVSELIHGRILVGHAVHNDLKVLFLTHPHKMVRDTSLYKPFRELFNGRLPSLKKLTEKVLAVRVQEGQHSSVQDAQATMRLYTMYRQKWEKELRTDRKSDRRKKKKKQNKPESVE